LLTAGSFLLTFLIPNIALADVVTDGTLGDGSSPTGPDFWITEAMGERPGGGPNLFHSFSEFSLGRTQSATFDGPGDVENILGRVTGGSRSEIFGAIRTAPSLGEVDLYLMNPRGIVFGESASLDINGSFHATTADSIGLGEGGERFYADPSQPSLLSTAPPSAFGFLGGGAVDDGLPAIAVENASLQVNDGESLSLIGRDVGSGGVEISGARLQAAGGRIDLVSVGSAGEVLRGGAEAPEPRDASGFESLGGLDIVSGSSMDVSGDPPGTVWIRGGRLVVEDSEVLAVNQGTDPSGGRISIAADESVLVSQEAIIDAGTVSSGAGGVIEVTAPELVIDRGRISSSTFSPGDAGTIRLDVGRVVIRNGYGFAAQQLAIPIGVSAETRGSGAGGRIEISAESVEITGGAGISASTITPSASGNAGTIEINAQSLALSDGGFVYGESSFGSSGDAGTIRLDLTTLEIDGARDDPQMWPSSVSVDTVNGSGAAGTIEIDAESIVLLNGGGIEASAGRNTSAPAGSVVITTGSLLVHGSTVFPGSSEPKGSFVAAYTRAKCAASSSCDAGSVDITAGSLLLGEGGFLSVETWDGSNGNGGSIRVVADSLVIRGYSTANTGIFASSLQPGTTGDAGIVEIEAGSVDIRGGGHINASANPGSAGDAGTISVAATDSVSISHAGGDRLSLSDIMGGAKAPTGIYSATVFAGDSGSITVSAPEITVTEGGIVGTSTLGGGDAGNVTLRGERIVVSNGAFVDSTSVPVSDDLPGGAAGSVMLEASESIAVEGRSAFGDQSRVASATLGPGSAGSVSLRAPLIVVDDGAVATTSVASPLAESGGRAGEIVVEAGELHVIGGGRVDSSSMTAGEAGSIRVVAADSLLVKGAGSGVSSRTGGPGPGGDVEVHAPRIEVRGGGGISAESSAGLQEARDIFGSVYDEGWIEEPPEVATGNAGSVTLEADQVLVQDGVIATYSEAADGGDVTVRASEMLHLIDGEITASVSSGSGGNIVIDPVFVILEGESRIVAQAITGSGGNISITTDGLLASQESVISASSELGVKGTVEIHSPETDVAGTLASLPETFLEAAALMKERCAARKGGESAGSFVWTGRQGVSWSPDGMIPASYAEAEKGPEPEPVGLVLGTSAETGERVALLVGCGIAPRN